MSRILTIILFTVTCYLGAFAEKVELEKKDYLKLIVSSYVNGFKEFDTSITTFDDSVSVGIYYDVSTQKEGRAKQLAKRFKTQIPHLLKSYKWAKDTKVMVSVYSEDRSVRGY